eukprot:jgi/Chrzof1/12029/Cz06g18200.t1
MAMPAPVVVGARSEPRVHITGLLLRYTNPDMERRYLNGWAASRRRWEPFLLVTAVALFASAFVLKASEADALAYQQMKSGTSAAADLAGSSIALELLPASVLPAIRQLRLGVVSHVPPWITERLQTAVHNFPSRSDTPFRMKARYSLMHMWELYAYFILVRPDIPLIMLLLFSALLACTMHSTLYHGTSWMAVSMLSRLSLSAFLPLSIAMWPTSAPLAVSQYEAQLIHQHASLRMLQSLRPWNSCLVISLSHGIETLTYPLPVRLRIPLGLTQWALVVVQDMVTERQYNRHMEHASGMCPGNAVPGPSFACEGIVKYFCVLILGLLLPAAVLWYVERKDRLLILLQHEAAQQQQHLRHQAMRRKPNLLNSQMCSNSSDVHDQLKSGSGRHVSAPTHGPGVLSSQQSAHLLDGANNVSQPARLAADASSNPSQQDQAKASTIPVTTAPVPTAIDHQKVTSSPVQLKPNITSAVPKPKKHTPHRGVVFVPSRAAVQCHPVYHSDQMTRRNLSAVNDDVCDHGDAPGHRGPPGTTNSSAAPSAASQQQQPQQHQARLPLRPPAIRFDCNRLRLAAQDRSPLYGSGTQTILISVKVRQNYAPAGNAPAITAYLAAGAAADETAATRPAGDHFGAVAARLQEAAEAAVRTAAVESGVEVLHSSATSFPGCVHLVMTVLNPTQSGSDDLLDLVKDQIRYCHLPGLEMLSAAVISQLNQGGMGAVDFSLLQLGEQFYAYPVAVAMDDDDDELLLSATQNGVESGQPEAEQSFEQSGVTMSMQQGQGSDSAGHSTAVKLMLPANLQAHLAAGSSLRVVVACVHSARPFLDISKTIHNMTSNEVTLQLPHESLIGPAALVTVMLQPPSLDSSSQASVVAAPEGKLEQVVAQLPLLLLPPAAVQEVSDLFDRMVQAASSSCIAFNRHLAPLARDVMFALDAPAAVTAHHAADAASMSNGAAGHIHIADGIADDQSPDFGVAAAADVYLGVADRLVQFFGQQGMAACVDLLLDAADVCGLREALVARVLEQAGLGGGEEGVVEHTAREQDGMPGQHAVVYHQHDGDTQFHLGVDHQQARSPADHADAVHTPIIHHPIQSTAAEHGGHGDFDTFRVPSSGNYVPSSAASSSSSNVQPDVGRRLSSDSSMHLMEDATSTVMFAGINLQSTPSGDKSTKVMECKAPARLFRSTQQQQGPHHQPYVSSAPASAQRSSMSSAATAKMALLGFPSRHLEHQYQGYKAEQVRPADLAVAAIRMSEVALTVWKIPCLMSDAPRGPVMIIPIMALVLYIAISSAPSVMLLCCRNYYQRHRDYIISICQVACILMAIPAGLVYFADPGRRQVAQTFISKVYQRPFAVVAWAHLTVPAMQQLTVPFHMIVTTFRLLEAFVVYRCLLQEAIPAVLLVGLVMGCTVVAFAVVFLCDMIVRRRFVHVLMREEARLFGTG